MVSKSTWQEFEDMQVLDEDIQLVKAWVQNGSRPEQKPANMSATLDTLYKNFDSFTAKNANFYLSKCYSLFEFLHVLLNNLSKQHSLLIEASKNLVTPIFE